MKTEATDVTQSKPEPLEPGQIEHAKSEPATAEPLVVAPQEQEAKSTAEEPRVVAEKSVVIEPEQSSLNENIEEPVAVGDLTTEPPVVENQESFVDFEEDEHVDLQAAPQFADIEEETDLLEMAQTEIFGDKQEYASEAPLSTQAVESVPNTQITERIAEDMELSETEQAQVETLSSALPEQVQESLVEYIEMAEPEQVEKIEQLVVSIAAVADRLHTLAENESLDTVEAEKIEEMIIKMYDELLEELGIELEEDQKKELLVRIKSGDFKLATQQETVQKIEETPEVKHAKLSFFDIKDMAYELIGRFAVRRTANLVSYQVDTV